MRIKYVGINDFKKCESSNNKKKNDGTFKSA